MDWSELGYLTRKSSKIGFYLSKCSVNNCIDKSLDFPLIGSEKGFLADKCLLPKSILDIDQKLFYRYEENWSRSDAFLEFRAFQVIVSVHESSPTV